MRSPIALLTLLALAAAAPDAAAGFQLSLHGLPTGEITGGQDIDFQIRLTGSETDPGNLVQSYYFVLRVESVGGAMPGPGTFELDLGGGGGPVMTPPPVGYVFGTDGYLFTADVDATNPGYQELIVTDLSSAAVQPVAGVNDLVFAARVKTHTSFGGTLKFSFRSDPGFLVLDQDDVGTPVATYSALQGTLSAQSNSVTVNSQAVPVPAPPSAVLGVCGVVAAVLCRRRFR